ncbi:MAG: hypothetical protein R3B70_18440 [Polyangiaceae bacterium]
MCPHCGQSAPIVYQGVSAYCSACGKPRAPLLTPSVSYAGKPSKVGGTVAGTLGWLVLAFGNSVALGIGLVLGSIWELTFALGFALPVAIFSTVVALLLLRSGKKLRESGDEKQRETRRRAIFALATNRAGVVHVGEASRALGVPPQEADDFLTDLARTMPHDVTVEIDGGGNIYYQFPRLLALGERRARVAADGQRVAAPHVRVAGVSESLDADAMEYEESAGRQGRMRR